MDTWQVVWQVLVTLAVVAVVATGLGAALLFWTIHRLRKIQLAPDAGFWETLRAVPLGLVVALDLLDLGLDVFAAPVVWFMLRRSGLERLRNVAVVESLLPFTQALPTMTLAWLLARAMPNGWDSLERGSRGASDRDYKTIDVEFRAPTP